MGTSFSTSSDLYYPEYLDWAREHYPQWGYELINWPDIFTRLTGSPSGTISANQLATSIAAIEHIDHSVAEIIIEEAIDAHLLELTEADQLTLNKETDE